MKINWKVRFKNGVFVTTFVSLVLSFIYNVLGLFEIVPPISEDTAMSIVIMIIQFLTGIGILTDPTTKGLSDSDRAMTYTRPH